ncbi:MAG: methylmalonyl-CoA mutase family protein [Dehalococcoidales bacterium]|nr:methylmalonyl-CoA mutase family protein [Dehalococcoidales bacterium]
MSENLNEIRKRRKEWEERSVKPALKRFGVEKNPNKFYTPAELGEFKFMEKVGFPGEYPFTAGPYPFNITAPAPRRGLPTAPGLVRAATYSGYGAAENTRDYYKEMQKRGQKAGPNLAFDLPTQCGYDSDNPLVRGDVGKTGVAVDTLRDFEVIYESFRGDLELDRIASNFTINAPANIILAMYFALAEKRNVPLDKLRGTPQNDILKEYIARGTYIFPPRPSMRMIRDSMVFLTENCTHMNINQLGGYHIRGAGGTREQDLAYSSLILSAYVQEGVNAGLDVDTFVPRFTVNAFGGSMEFFKEIAFQRAARRVWAKIIRDKFHAKNERSMLLRQPWEYAHIGPENCTAQRVLNNLTRSVVGGIASALSGGQPITYPPFDEPLGLGWSLEASQLAEDAERILQYEARLTEVTDPLAGSYYVESLTDAIENGAMAESQKVEKMGGIVSAIESGYVQAEIAKSAYERQKRIENGEDLVIGVNCFTGESELEVQVSRNVPHPYSPAKRTEAERNQIKNLKEVKKTRNNRKVKQLLKELEQKARNEQENLMPHFIECAKEYATLQEMCDVLRGVFGEYRPKSI